MLVTLFWDTLYLLVFLYILYICNNCLYILVFLNCHPEVLVAVAAPDSFNVPRVSPPSSTSPAIVYNNTLVFAKIVVQDQTICSAIVHNKTMVFSNSIQDQTISSAIVYNSTLDLLYCFNEYL